MEAVALAFIADVQAAVTGVRDLSANAQRLAGTAKEAATAVGDIAGPATATADSTKALAESATAAADAEKRLAVAARESATAARESATAAEGSAAKTDAAGASAAGFGKKLGIAALGLGIAAAASVKMAGDFQQSMTKLVTSAGESMGNLKSDMAGVISMSVQTDTSVQELASGLYMINSAGFHGAQGLQILKAAAEGAKAEGASLADVSNAVTSALNAYGMGAGKAVAVTDQLVVTVGQGKMTMQDLASSIHTVLPVAAAAHIGIAQVGGAIATMTMQGMSAQQATLDLAHTIGVLQNPNAVAVKEMGQLGLSSNDVADKLGKRGLTGTIQLLEETVMKNMGPSGDVMLKVFNQSKAAAQDAVTMMHALPPSLQSVAKGFLDGTISQTQWTASLKGLAPIVRAQASEFATTAKNAHGFNAALRAGLPGTQTFEAALSKMMGGATGLNTALMVGGAHMSTFRANVEAVAKAGEHAGRNVAGWDKIQGEFNFKLGQAGKAAKAVGYSFGDALLPAATAVMSVVASLGLWFTQNTWAAVTLATVIGGALSVAIGGKMVTSLREGIQAFRELGPQLFSAGKSVVSFAATVVVNTAKAMAATTVWIARQAVAAATYIAEQAAQAAAATAAFVAENLATLGIIAGIALLIAGIVLLATHWKEVWGVVKTAALDAWYFLDNDVIHPIQRGIAVLVDWVKAHWQLLATILATVLLGPVGFLVAFIATHWQQIVHATSALVSDVESWFRQLPGRILNALGDLGSLLWNAGVSLIRGLINGIESMFSSLGSVASSIGSFIANLKGPLPKDLTLLVPHGQAIMQGLMDGIASKKGELASLLGGVTGAIPGMAIGGGIGGTAAAPSVHVTVPLTLGAGTAGYSDPRFLQYLQTVVQEAVLRYTMTNPTNGLSLAR